MVRSLLLSIKINCRGRSGEARRFLRPGEAYVLLLVQFVVTFCSARYRSSNKAQEVGHHIWHGHPGMWNCHHSSRLFIEELPRRNGWTWVWKLWAAPRTSTSPGNEKDGQQAPPRHWATVPAHSSRATKRQQERMVCEDATGPCCHCRCASPNFCCGQLVTTVHQPLCEGDECHYLEERSVRRQGCLPRHWAQKLEKPGELLPTHRRGKACFSSSAGWSECHTGKISQLRRHRARIAVINKQRDSGKQRSDASRSNKFLLPEHCFQWRDIQLWELSAEEKVAASEAEEEDFLKEKE